MVKYRRERIRKQIKEYVDKVISEGSGMDGSSKLANAKTPEELEEFIREATEKAFAGVVAPIKFYQSAKREDGSYTQYVLMGRIATGLFGFIRFLEELEKEGGRKESLGVYFNDEPLQGEELAKFWKWIDEIKQAENA